MEQRNAQEMSTLLDVAYVVCYGHFPDSENNNSKNNNTAKRPSKDSFIESLTRRTSDAAAPPTRASPGATGISPDTTFEGETTPSDEDEGNPFREDDGNPFSEDGDDENNPFSEDTNPFGEDETDGGNECPTKEKDPTAFSQEDSISFGKTIKCKEETTLQNIPNELAVGLLHTHGQIDSVISSQSDQDLPNPLTDPNSPLAMAMKLNDKRRVSQTHAREILSEAFNLTKLDLNRLVDETRNTKMSPTVELLLEEIRTEGLPVSPPSETYPILFLRAKVGQDDKFTNFSSTSATNTIEQGLTLNIQNMYNDILTMEVWSANVLPVEDPQPPPKLDLLGRIMSGSMRLKKDDLRFAKTLKNLKGGKEDLNNTESETSLENSRQTASPNTTNENSPNINDDVASGLQNGDTVDHDGPQSQSLDYSDSLSISSEMSNDPLKTSTPRGRSSSLQHLEATNMDDSPPKKGFRSSFRLKAGHFIRSSQSNLKKSNQSLNTTDSASPDLSRKPSDAQSMQSEYDVSYQDRKLDREHSKSSLSIASLTKRTFSMRLSSKKVSGHMKRFASVRVKKKDMPDGTLPHNTEFDALNQSHPNTSIQNESPQMEDNGHVRPVEQSSLPQNHIVNIETIEALSPKTISRRLLTPRTMRPFRNLKNLNISHESKNEVNPVSPTRKSPTEKVDMVKVPKNPEKIQQYLSRIGKEHLQAERIAYVNVPLKSIVGEWVKESWIPMTIVSNEVDGVNIDTGKKKKKTKKNTAEETVVKNDREVKVLCKMHVKLALPVPLESDINSSPFESYNSTYAKLVNLQVRTLDDLTDYKGSVGVVGDILLDQLVFFSRVSVWHQKLVSWLVLAEKKPSDSSLLLPFLLAIKGGLQDGQFVTAQKLKMGESLSKWVRFVMLHEFETLHSSFPCNSLLVHLPRLEDFLRCFNAIEEDNDLKILFEREMNLINFPSLTDQLKGALVRHAEIWIEALNKEPMNQKDSNLNLEGTGANSDEAKWLDDLRRAAHLLKPIEDFLVICVYTYQPIFMTEMSVDYLYWVLPKFFTATLHLVMKTHRFPISKVRSLPTAYFPSAAQAAWKICSNISSINKIAEDSKLPIHLIEQDFRTAYSNSVLQWLTLSRMLSLQELENDFQQEEFIAVDPTKGYSHSAVSMVDILKAIMSRLQGLCWPGGIRPGVNTLSRIAKHIVLIVNYYTERITSTYTTRECQTGRIPTEACVVVRNVEHVCDEARQQLSTLASWAEQEIHVEEELNPAEDSDGLELKPEGRNQKLQEQIDSAAEKLLQKCLPELEVILKQGVSADKPDHIIEHMVSILQPIEDRLYFAESLLYELWNRIFKEAETLTGKLQQGQWRGDLRRLEKSLKTIHSFLTDTGKVGFQLPDPAVQEYEKFIDDLKMSGASSPALVAMYYNERYSEQCKEVDSKNPNIIITNVTFSKDGLKVYIAQAPGNSRGGVLVKARVEPQAWFPNSLPLKTRLVKDDIAVFDETLNFYEVHHDGPHNETEENGEGGGVLILQMRTPKIFVGSVVHSEAIIPLATVPRVNDSNRHTVHHLRLPLTRPWSSKNYKALRNLKTRTQDACANDFLKMWQTRWEGTDDAPVTHETIKGNSNFIRAASLRLSSKRRASLREAPVK